MGRKTPLVRRARELARLAHADHRRKAGDIPYFTHLEAVVEILEEHGYDDETVLSAAFLHDLIEDRPAFEPRLRAEMPTAVIETVEVVTEKKQDARGAHRTKALRFRDYARALTDDTRAARRATPISCADKIHNMRSLVWAENHGHSLLARLSTRPGQHRAQLATLRPIYEARVSAALLATFDETRDALLSMIDAWLPGRAIAIAAEAHLGQYDHGGLPYIEHPMRLMMNADGRDDRIVAILHDVVEDTRWTLEDLAEEGFSEDVLRAMNAMTHRADETYEDYIERVAADRRATRIKLLDLEDNANLARIPNPTERDFKRMERYALAKVRLQAEQAKRTLYLRLDEASRGALAEHARHPVVRADHVTLAYRAPPERSAAELTPGGHAIGSTVSFDVVAEHDNGSVQAVRVAFDGESARPFDGETLHVTVSRQPDARSKDARAALDQPAVASWSMSLAGTVVWERESSLRNKTT